MIEISLILIAVGFIAGTIGSLVGLGGGVIIVPALLYIGLMHSSIEVSPQVAVGTSLVVIIFNGLSSTLSYSKQKKVDFQSGLLFFVASGPGAIIGALVVQYMNVSMFNVSFGLFIIFISILLTMRGKWKKRDIAWGVKRTYDDPLTGERIQYGYHRGIGLTIAFVVGMLSGLFGIGGGALMVPVMLILFHFPTHVATATSMFIIFLSAILGSMTHLYYGTIEWMFVLALAPGAWLGGRCGAYLSTKINANGISIVLRLTLVIIGLRLIWNEISTM